MKPLLPKKEKSLSKILVADDNCFNLIAIQNILKQLGFYCDTCYNGKEILEKVIEMKNINHEYELIILDFEMPIMDGVSVRID